MEVAAVRAIEDLPGKSATKQFPQESVSNPTVKAVDEVPVEPQVVQPDASKKYTLDEIPNLRDLLAETPLLLGDSAAT